MNKLRLKTPNQKKTKKPTNILLKKSNIGELCLLHVIWTEHQMSKLVFNVKYLLWLSFLTAAEFYNLAHIRVHYSKEIIFSNLGYFQICFSCRLKNSKQTFKTKFVIRQWQWNESDISESLYPRGLSHSVPKTIKVSFVFYLHFHM